MKAYSVAEKRQVEFANKPEIVITKNGRYALAGKCIKGHKMVKFISKKDLQDGSGLLSMLGLKTPLSKIPILGNILF